MSQQDSQSCPVCGLNFKSLQQLERHVEEHFDEQPRGTEDPVVSHTTGVDGSEPLNSVLCPFGCGQWVPLQELDEHEKVHEVAMSEGLAQSLAAGGRQQNAPRAAPSDEEQAQLMALQAAEWGDAQAAASREDNADWDEDEEWGEGDEDANMARQLQEQQDFEALQAQYGFSTKREGHCYICKQEGHWARDCPDNPHAARNRPRLPLDPTLLASQQIAEPQWQGAGSADVIPLLAERLAHQRLPYKRYHNEAWLCGPVQHFNSNVTDRGWGCGWRNIQMQVSHLLMRPGSVHKATLLGSKEMVPDIGSLQAWLEVAWAAGFDVAGADSLGNTVQCGSKWVGTTEAYTLLRYHHVPAHIIDFTGPSGSRNTSSSTGATIHTGVTCDRCEQCPIVGVRLRSLSRPDFDLCELCGRLPDLQDAGPFQRLGRGSSEQQQQQQQGAASQGAGAQINQLRGGTRQSEQACRQQGGAAGRQGQHAPTDGLPWWEAGQHNGQERQQTRGRGRGRGKRGRMQDHMDHTQQQPTSRGPTYTPMQTALLQWLWKYFTGEHEATASMHGAQNERHREVQESISGPRAASCTTSVYLTGMPPLYLQHAGHSRTIIGIERKPRPDIAAESSASPSLEAMFGRSNKRGPGQREAYGDRAWQAAAADRPGLSDADNERWVYCLLILDPSCPAHEFVAALKRNQGWQKYVKRGLPTLRHDEYQLLYCMNRVATAAEEEAGKIVKPAEVVRAAHSN